MLPSCLALLSFFFTAQADIPGDVPLTLLNGETVNNQEYKQKAILFVNVASKCGYTGQYDDLQKLYTQYKDKGLEVVGVPCNQFGGQEPGSAEEIQASAAETEM